MYRCYYFNPQFFLLAFLKYSCYISRQSRSPLTTRMVDAILNEINKKYILEDEGMHVDVNKDVSPVLQLSLLMKKRRRIISDAVSRCKRCKDVKGRRVIVLIQSGFSREVGCLTVEKQIIRLNAFETTPSLGRKLPCVLVDVTSAANFHTSR